MPFEVDQALSEKCYYSVEPHRTFRSGALKPDNTHGRKCELNLYTPHTADSTNHMDTPHTYPYQNWHDCPRSGHSDQMHGMQDYSSLREPSHPHHPYHGSYDLSIGDPSANAGLYQDGYPNPDEGNTNNQHRKYV